VVAQDLDDVETDQRLVLGDDNPSRGGGCGLLRHLLFSHGTILVERGCAPGRRRGLPMTQESGAPFGRTGLLSAGGGTRTHTPLRTKHFECSASAIPPRRPGSTLAHAGGRTRRPAPFRCRRQTPD